MILNLNGMGASKQAFLCCSITLIINSAAYVSEVIRSGIQAVDKGQTEAARSLGLTSSTTMIKIVLPQAVKNILPALGNEDVYKRQAQNHALYNACFRRTRCFS